jgi:hypothetical protein
MSTPATPIKTSAQTAEERYSAEPPPGQPTDAELLVDFHSPYEKFPPDKMLQVDGLTEGMRSAAELLRREREQFLVRRRRELAQAQAQADARAAEAERKRQSLEKALRQEARTALLLAVESYPSWIAKRDELRDSLTERQTTLETLLANQSAEVDFDQLKAQTTEIADSRLLVDALTARLEAWKPREEGYLVPLRQAVREAQGELATLHHYEREKRIDTAKKALGKILDLNRLYDLAKVDLERLAQAAYPIIELDSAASYDRSGYSWNWQVDDRSLLARAAQLEKLYETLLPLIARS